MLSKLHELYLFVLILARRDIPWSGFLACLKKALSSLVSCSPQRVFLIHVHENDPVMLIAWRVVLSYVSLDWSSLIGPETDSWVTHIALLSPFMLKILTLEMCCLPCKVRLLPNEMCKLPCKMCCSAHFPRLCLMSVQVPSAGLLSHMPPLGTLDRSA